MTILIEGAEYARMQCGLCGIVHYMPEVLRAECKKQGDKKSWHCPNGHERVYRKSAADELRRQCDLLTQRLAQKDDEILQQTRMKQQAEKSATAYKGQVTRFKNRAHAGLCSCCNRHFTNLQRHMASKHKDETNVVPLRNGMGAA